MVNFVDEYLNERIPYGGLPLPRHEVMQDLDRKGIVDPSPARFGFLSKTAVQVSDEWAAMADDMWEAIKEEDGLIWKS